MLSSKDFEKIALPMCYLGDFPVDQLPLQTGHKRPWCLISNTDTHTEPGTHWMAICAPPNQNEMLFIDPLALFLHKILPDLRAWMGAFPGRVITIPFPVQPLTSTWCGAYCAFILHHLPKFNYDLHHLIHETFSMDDLSYNDNFVMLWWKSMSIK